MKVLVKVFRQLNQKLLKINVNNKQPSKNSRVIAKRRDKYVNNQKKHVCNEVESYERYVQVCRLTLMKIKQYFSRDLRSAVLKVKKELGVNAVILSHHYVDEGVEVTAAIDEEYGLHAGQLPPMPYLKVSKPAAGHDIIPITSSPGIRKTFFFNSCGSSQNEFNIEAHQSSGNDSCTTSHADNSAGCDSLNLHNRQKCDSRHTTNKSTGFSTEQSLSECDFMNKVVSSTSQDERDSIHYMSASMNGHHSNNLTSLIEQQITEHAWGEVARKNPLRSQLIRQLLKIDLHPIIIQSITDTISTQNLNQKTAFAQVQSLLADQLPIYKEDVTSYGGTIAVFGATGVGKTTTIAKMAARFALQNGRNKVGLITTDSKRLGAKEQLDLYSRILGIPLKVVRDEMELLDALNAFSEKSFVLIDTAGMGPREIATSKYLELFSGAITQIKNFLVLPATAHRVVLENNARAFQEIKLDGSILTRLDDSVSLGGPLSVAIMNNLPVAYYCDGQKIPDDFHLARAHNLVSFAVSAGGQFSEPQAVETEHPVKAGKAANVSI